MSGVSLGTRSEMLSSPERTHNHAQEFSQGLQDKYLKLKIKNAKSLIEARNLRQQLNTLTKQIGLKLVDD